MTLSIIPSMKRIALILYKDGDHRVLADARRQALRSFGSNEWAGHLFVNFAWREKLRIARIGSCSQYMQYMLQYTKDILKIQAHRCP